MSKIKSVIIAVLGCTLVAFFIFRSDNTENQLDYVDTVNQAGLTGNNNVSPKILAEDKNKEAAKDSVIETIKNDDIDKFSDFIDMNKWLYNDTDGVYYQTGIIYAQTLADATHQKLAVFIPEKYLKCQKNTHQTYSCKINTGNSTINKYNSEIAPFAIEIESPDFAAVPALKKYQNHRIYTDAGIIYVHIGFRGINSGAPYGVADIKTAIRYLRNNKGIIPGNTSAIYTLAANHGAMLAAILGASGNDKLYLPYLKENGAFTRIDDNILGVMLINPLCGLDTENEAIEWFVGNNRKNMSEEQKKLSDKMAKEYADYINRAGFVLEMDKGLTLQYSDEGIYQEGTYFDYIKSIIIDSLQQYIQEHPFPLSIPKLWEISEDDAIAQDNIKLYGTIQTKDKFFSVLNSHKPWIADYGMHGIRIKSLSEFKRIFFRKIPPLFSVDGLDKQQKANILFGIGNGKGLRFDTYTAQILKNVPHYKEDVSDLYKRDKNGYSTIKRVNMYNPLYYLLSSYEGYNSSDVAPFWYIQSGLFQTTAPLTSAINLILAVEKMKNVKYVDKQIVWGMGDVERITDENRKSFINWIALHK